MRLFEKCKDGGPDSNVTAYVLCEFKSLFSVMILRFDAGSREVYHSHAFNCWSLVLWGLLTEKHLAGGWNYHHAGAIIGTFRDTFHKVYSIGTTWVFTVRGPWSKLWFEADDEGRSWVLTNGRKRRELP
jgi:hypothetical protein